MPGFWIPLQNSSHDWSYYTESCSTGGLGLNNQQSFWPRGKMLGGSGAMNAMLYVRGNRRDYDLYWQQAGGADWSWDAISPYFKDPNNNATSDDDIDLGPGEPLSIEFYSTSEFDINIKSMLRGMFEDLGFEHFNEFYGEQFNGLFRIRNLLKKATRQSSAKAYIPSSLVGARSNLHVLKMAHVHRLIIDKTTKQVNGVEFTRLPEQKKLLAKVRNEVILSAGAINTPQILMLSGIGPTDQLDSHKIERILSLDGVGRHLQDHIMVPLFFSFHKSTAPTITHQTYAENFFNYLLYRKGPFSHLGSVDYMAFFSTLNDPLYPDIQVMNFLVPKGYTNELTLLLKLQNYHQNIIDQIVVANSKADTHFALSVLLNPKSHGRITLRSKNPFDSPKIYPNYLQEDDDVNTLVRSLKKLSKLTESKTFKEHEGEHLQIKLAKCDVFEKNADEYWACYVRHLMITVYHPVGTAKMGPENDSSSVVDAQLNVIGLKGLRVADASM